MAFRHESIKIRSNRHGFFLGGAVLFHLARVINDRIDCFQLNKEVAVSLRATDIFRAADTESDQMKDSSQKIEALPENPVDPLKDVIQQLNARNSKEQQKSAIDNYGVVDPLAEDIQQIDQTVGGHYLIKNKS